MTVQSQEEILEKSIETGDFLSNQGLLRREQQREFIVLLKRYSSMFQSVRTVVMPQASMDINKLHLGEPVTISLTENSNPAQDNKLKANQVHLDTKKVRSAHDITTETLQQNIEQDEFEVTAMRSFAARMALDLELLALLGDESIAPALPQDKLGQLLQGNDGWFKLAQQGHVLDLGGATIETGIFSEMLRRLPKQYRGDPGLRFIVGETLVIDWQDLLQARATGLGDAALADMGPSRSPFGKRFMVAPLIPDDLPLAVSESVPAVVQGVSFGPFQVVPGINDTLTININGLGAIAITIVPLGPGGAPLTSGGYLETRQIVKQINDAFAAVSYPALAFDNGDGLVTIRTRGTGAAVSIAITAGGAADISDTLGLTDGIANVAVAGADNSGTVLEGGFIMLTNPRNLIWGILDGTRVFSEFNKDYDRTEVVAFNQVDAEIENPDALVLATNLRRKNHVLSAIP